MLFDRYGIRKYLTIAERRAFIAVARRLGHDEATFCLMLAYTGARISEVLALTPGRIDLDAGIIVIETLKRRRDGIFRAVPIPRTLMRMLVQEHHLSDVCGEEAFRLWPWSRTKAWACVKQTLIEAGVPSSRAMPKALRHGFAAGCLEEGVPLNVVQKWMGHARISTTAIYGDLMGREERHLAQKAWKRLEFMTNADTDTA